MKLYIKERVFSWSDTYDIFNEYGDCVYQGQAELFAFGHQINIFKNREVIARIEQKLFTMMPKFELYLHEQYVGELVKEFTFFKPAYHIKNLEWQVQGNIFSHEYTTIDENGREVFTIYKEYLTWGDTYCLNIERDENVERAILVAIAIDAATCEK